MDILNKFISLAIVVVLILLQIELSKKHSIRIRFIMPLVFFALSLFSFIMRLQSGIKLELVKQLTLFLISNIPTLILLGVDFFVNKDRKGD